MMVPPEYEGREQSWLKHRILEEYLKMWSHKIGSLQNKIWFVDCFSGPWRSKHQDLKDTSIDIGLRVLASAKESWKDHDRDFELGAVFVEKEPSAFAELEEYLDKYHSDSPIDIHPIHGRFGENTSRIERLLRDDPAFIFVDPTGFKGAAMEFIRPLLRPRVRDVLVNVMYEYANRFSADLQEHLLPFFRVEPEEIQDLSESQLLALYRSKLKEHCSVRFAADLRVPRPTQERTCFRLVVGGKDKEVIKVFRDVEHRVMGSEAGHARDAARRAARARREGGEEQMGLFGSSPEQIPMPDDGFAQQHADDLVRLREGIVSALPARDSRRWEEIWPQLLEEHHVTLSQLNRVAAQVHKEGAIIVDPWPPRRQVPHDSDRVRRATPLDPNSRP